MQRITNVCVHCQFMLLENYLPVAGGSLSQIAQIQKKQIWESFEQPEFIRWMIDVLNYFRFMMMNPTLCNLDSTKKIVDTFQYELEKIIWKKKSWECQLIIQC